MGNSQTNNVGVAPYYVGVSPTTQACVHVSHVRKCTHVALTCKHYVTHARAWTKDKQKTINHKKRMVVAMKKKDDAITYARMVVTILRVIVALVVALCLLTSKVVAIVYGVAYGLGALCGFVVVWIVVLWAWLMVIKRLADNAESADE